VVTLAVTASALAATAVRLWQVQTLPVITGDVVRNLLYGIAVRDAGLSAAQLPLVQIDPAWRFASWSWLPYSYPPLALAFFALVSAISPTVYAAKLALTFVEAANGALVWRLTHSRWLGVLYWASPASIWWTSREGQFEPLQSLFTLLSLAAAPRFALAGGLSLAAAIQVKLTAAALVPLVAHRCWKAGPRALRLAALGLTLGLLPSLALELRYGALSNVLRFSSPLVYNPYYWNWTAAMFSWNPGWLVLCDELSSYGILAALVAYAIRTRSAWTVAAPIAFLAFCKLHSNVQFWYFLLLAPLLVPIEDRRWRFALIAAVPLLDVGAAVSLLGWPIGQHGFHGLPSVFDVYVGAPR
jgi:hypothetical protein